VIAAGTSLKTPAVVLDGGMLSAAALDLNPSTEIETLTVRAGGGIVGAPAVTVTGSGRLALTTDNRITVALVSRSIDEVGARGLLTPATMSLAINAEGHVSQSDYPSGEFPGLALDTDANTKWLDFDGQGPGIIIPGFTQTLVQSIWITRANDYPGRDSANTILYGTDDLITSADNSSGGISAANLRADIIAGPNGGAWDEVNGITSSLAKPPAAPVPWAIRWRLTARPRSRLP
jgi:hypothetical protein